MLFYNYRVLQNYKHRSYVLNEKEWLRDREGDRQTDRLTERQAGR